MDTKLPWLIVAVLALCFLLHGCASPHVYVVWTVGDIMNAVFWGFILVFVLIMLAAIMATEAKHKVREWWNRK